MKILEFDCPLAILFQSTCIANKRAGGILIAFQMPVEPIERDRGVLAAMRPAIRSTVPNVQVRHHDGNVIHSREIVHGIFVRDIGWAAHDV